MWDNAASCIHSSYLRKTLSFGQVHFKLEQPQA